MKAYTLVVTFLLNVKDPMLWGYVTSVLGVLSTFRLVKIHIVRTHKKEDTQNGGRTKRRTHKTEDTQHGGHTKRRTYKTEDAQN